MKIKEKFPIILLLIFIFYFIILAINPYDRKVWLAEIIPVILIVISLIITHKKFKFSNISYILIGIFLFLHTTGAHFTFERVLFGFITELFNFQRNNFDRISHFTVGFFAYPIVEFFSKKSYITKKWLLYLTSFCIILAIASFYEIIEWLYAINTDTKQANDFLGSQGDIWDTQKDMLMDGLGAIFALLIFSITKKD